MQTGKTAVRAAFPGVRTAILVGDHALSDRLLDGQFGNNNALQVVRQAGSLHLISKLRYDAALYFRYDGPYGGRGPRRKYGDKITCHAMPDKYLVKTSCEQGIRTDIYQAIALHACFAQPLNVVIIVKTKLQTQAQAHVILFSSGNYQASSGAGRKGWPTRASWAACRTL
jgi:hypothetical protein